MRLYLAGKIKGDPNYRAKFAMAEAVLKSQQHTVLSPTKLPEGRTPSFYMKRCFRLIEKVDGVALLPDWRQSGGARLERDFALYIGVPVYEFDELTN